MHKLQHTVLPLTALFGMFFGCTSVESTMVTRDEANQHWERHNCLNGIPITLKVPTHLKVYVFHKHYLQEIREPILELAVPPATTPAREATTAPDVSDPAAPAEPAEKPTTRIVDYQPVDVGVVIRDFAQELMYTDKVFVVDFKRPAGGSSNLKVKMTDQQYIDKIQHDITDTTISDVRGILAATKTDATPNKPFVQTGAELATKNELRSLVAVGIFEIDSPDFEQKVREFMDCHINKAHDAWFAPPRC